MQEERFVDNNVVNLVGIVLEECTFSHKVFSEGFYIFKLRVPRLSENEDILPVTVSERLIDVGVIKAGAKVSVKGQLRSYNYYSENRNRLVLTVFAREIELLEEEEIKGSCLQKNTFRQRNNRHSCGGQPFLQQIGLHTCDYMGKECQICGRACSRRQY